MQAATVYEQPLNERVRSLLRLEFLFAQFSAVIDGESEAHSRMALVAINDILLVLSRTDLKSELVKELERQIATLNALRDMRGVDQEQLRRIIGELNYCSNQLLEVNGLIGAELRQNELLNSMRQRSSIAGGTCAFDLPLLHYWLHRPAEQRQADLKLWQQQFTVTETATGLILRLIRDCALPSQELASGGFFQKQLGGGGQYQMIRVLIDPALAVYPEISGSKHRFSVRFIRPAQHTQRAAQASDDIPFQLCICAL